MELNREQIITAMECCYDNNLSCSDCPFQATDKYLECSGLTLSALSLIKELTEENERLKSDKEFYRNEALYATGLIAGMTTRPSFEWGRKMKWSSFTPLGEKSKEMIEDEI